MTQPVRGKMIWLDEAEAHFLCVALTGWVHHMEAVYTKLDSHQKKMIKKLEEIMIQCGHPKVCHCELCHDPMQEQEPKFKVSFADILDAVFK